MRHMRLRTTRMFDIVGLIDIIFLLLIFGMIVLGISYATGKLKARERPDVLKVTLGWRALDAGRGQSFVVIEYPSPEGMLTSNQDFPRDDRLSEYISDGSYPNKSGFRLIRDKLAQYKEDYDEAAGDKPNFITLDVAENTKFALIGYVVEECSVHWDTTFWLDIGVI